MAQRRQGWSGKRTALYQRTVVATATMFRLRSFSRHFSAVEYPLNAWRVVSRRDIMALKPTHANTDDGSSPHRSIRCGPLLRLTHPELD